MSKKMLIDATHAEETRVAVVDGHRLMDFDYESKVRRQLKGSIFLAKVTRVEPSLQAAFVNFGGNRHGFLPFSEIHPDYYRIPVADREALMAEQQRELEEMRAREEAEEAEEAAREARGESATMEESGDDSFTDSDQDLDDESIGGSDDPVNDDTGEDSDENRESEDVVVGVQDFEELSSVEGESDLPSGESNESSEPVAAEGDDEGGGARGGRRYRSRGRRQGRGGGGRDRDRGGRMEHRSRRVEMLGGDGIEGDHPVRPTLRRHYKIQEVIKRGQIMLIQVSKEERGSKGAAVSTFLSLPGRYCVLMPNSPRAGGVSRKIANYNERKRMREILSEFQVPEGMSVILRTAGVSRTKAEIKRDLDYLMRLWDSIRDLTLQSTAPALIHEEGNLIRRSIRDIYGPEIDEIHIAGGEGYKLARDFMRMMIPSHAKRVYEYTDTQIPLFNRYQVESQIAAMSESTVTLKSGGYLVINPTEALVSIDVNSGRATRERHIEETALKTNLEAADEVARQLRLRDLGGLIVIDFIDMEDRRNNRKVENRLRDALSVDRARIQMGRISSFGLLEMSRQRLNPSLTEAQFEKCDHCKGMGYVRTVDSAAIMAMRALEDEGVRGRSSQVILRLPSAVAIYILNNKRQMITAIEQRYGFTVMIRVDETLVPSGHAVEPVRGAPTRGEIVVSEYAPVRTAGPDDEESNSEEFDDSDSEVMSADSEAEGDTPRREGSDRSEGRDRGRRGGRRRGRRGGRGRGGHDRDNHDRDNRGAYAGNESFGSPEGESGPVVDDDNIGNIVPDTELSEVDDNIGNRRDEPDNDRPRRNGGRRDRYQGRGRGGGNGGGYRGRDRNRNEGGGGRRQYRDRDGHYSRERVVEPSNAEDSGSGYNKMEPLPSSYASAPTPVTQVTEPLPRRADPSNDAPPPPREYERVNEPPAEKKKGWWNRFTE